MQVTHSEWYQPDARQAANIACLWPAWTVQGRRIHNNPWKGKENQRAGDAWVEEETF